MNLLANCLLVWQVYQLQTELQKAQMGNESQVQRPLRCPIPETPQLHSSGEATSTVKADELDSVRIISSEFFYLQL